jgi:hypothetical protein
MKGRFGRRSLRAGRRSRSRAPTRRLRSLRLALVLLVIVSAACVPVTLAFAEGGTPITQQEREEKAAQKRALYEQRRAAARAAREERLAQARARREALSGTRETPFGRVSIGCSSVTWFFWNFPTSRPTTVRELVSIDGHTLPPFYFTVTGETGSNTTSFAEVPGMHAIDAMATWKNGEFRGGWDITAHRVCAREPNPGFTIEKRQAIVGSGGGFAPQPVVGEVGQTVAYEIVVTNTGNTPLTFSNFSDPHCDPGTLTGGPQLPIEPGVGVKFRCTHVITAADQEAGSYTNVASITGTPNGGPPIEHESNTVVATVPTPMALPPETPGGGATQTPGATSGPTGSTGVLASRESQVPRIETSPSSIAIPALNGAHEGCVRSSFVASIKARGVSSVTFYVDRHKLKRLTARNARKGRLSVRVYVTHLRVGVHRLTARITMAARSASAKAHTATRSLKFARCASATVSPHFTG